MQPSLALAVKDTGPRLAQTAMRPHRGDQVAKFAECRRTRVLHPYSIRRLRLAMKRCGEGCCTVISNNSLLCSRFSPTIHRVLRRAGMETVFCSLMLLVG